MLKSSTIFITFVLSIFYPFALWLELGWRWVIIAFIIIWGLKALLEFKNRILNAIFCSFFLASYLVDSNILAMLYPSLINLGLFCVFIWSLRKESIITHFAKLEHQIKNLPPLSEDEIRYTRILTLIWSGIFVWNFFICTFLLLFSKQNLWAIYSGIGSYIIVGIAFIGERLLRKQIQAICFKGKDDALSCY